MFYQKGVTPAIANPPEGGVWRCLVPLPRPLLAVCLFGFTPHSYAHLYTHNFTFTSLHHHHHQLTRSHYYYYTFLLFIIIIFLIPFLLLVFVVCLFCWRERGRRTKRGEPFLRWVCHSFALRARSRINATAPLPALLKPQGLCANWNSVLGKRKR